MNVAVRLHYNEKHPRNKLTSFGIAVSLATVVPSSFAWLLTCWVPAARPLSSYWYPGIAFSAGGMWLLLKAVVETWQTRRPILTRAGLDFYFEKSPKAYVIMLAIYGCFAALAFFSGAVAILDAIRAG